MFLLSDLLVGTHVDGEVVETIGPTRMRKDFLCSQERNSEEWVMFWKTTIRYV